VPRQEIRLDLLSAPQSGVVNLRPWWQHTVRTDRFGSFQFNNLPAGTYSFVATNESLESDILEIVTLRPDDVVVEEEFDFGVTVGTPGGGQRKQAPEPVRNGLGGGG